MRRTLLVLIAIVAGACGGSKSPAGPSTAPPPAPTKIIRVFGSMDYGAVQLGQSKTNVLTIVNDGTATLNVTGMTVSGTSGLGSMLAASPQTGSVGPNGSMQVTIRFTPAAAASYTGTINVASDATSGTGSIAFVGQGTLDGIPIFRATGVGNTAFDVPSHVARVRIIGTYTANSSNFVVRYNGALIVNELLGTFWNATRYDGTHQIGGGGGTLAITLSGGVAWSIEEVR